MPIGSSVLGLSICIVELSVLLHKVMGPVCAAAFWPVEDSPGKFAESVTALGRSLEARFGVCLKADCNFWKTETQGSYFAANVKPSLWPVSLMRAIRPSQVDRELCVTLTNGWSASGEWIWKR